MATKSHGETRQKNKNFDEWLALFDKYSENGSVPQSFITPEGAKLGKWVSIIRSGRKKLTEAQIAKLNERNFVWHVFDRAKPKTFDEWLRIFEKYAKNGRIPNNFVTPEGDNLGRWVNNIRVGNIRLSEEQIQKLNDKNFIWRLGNFPKSFEEWLKLFDKYNRNGYIPKSFVTPEGNKLGLWVIRTRKNKHKLTAEQRAELDVRNFAWEIREARQNKTFEKWLEIFDKYNQNGTVPYSFITPEGYRLGRWVSYIRERKDKLTQKEIAKLNARYFVWKSSKTKTFDEWLAIFDKYNQNGHVDCTFITPNGENLGRWTSNIRSGRIKLTEEQYVQLDARNFNWEIKRKQKTRVCRKFKTFYEWLAIFDQYSQNGSVPLSFVTPNGERLGKWVSHIRENKVRLNDKQRAALNERHFVWKAKDVKKAKTFEEWLAIFDKYNNDGYVPLSFVTPENDYLGRWVGHVRSGDIKLTTEQIVQLNARHFVWNAATGLYNIKKVRNLL